MCSELLHHTMGGIASIYVNLSLSLSSASSTINDPSQTTATTDVCEPHEISQYFNIIVTKCIAHRTSPNSTMAPSPLSRSRRSLRTPPRATRAKPTLSYAEPSSSGTELEGDDDYAFDSDPPSRRNEPLPSRSRKASNAQTLSMIHSPSKKRYRPGNPESDDEITYAKPAKKRRSSTMKSTSHTKPLRCVIQMPGKT